MSCFICNIIKRGFLYEILIAFAVCHMIDAYRYYRGFHRKFIGLLEDAGIYKSVEPIVKKIEPTMEINYKIYLISSIVCAGFAILNIKYLSFFRILSALFAFLSAFIFYNPIPETKKFFSEKRPLTDISGFLPETEFILLFTLGAAMMAHYFKPEEPCVKKEEKELEDKEEKKVKSQNKSTPNKNNNSGNQNRDSNKPKKGKGGKSKKE